MNDHEELDPREKLRRLAEVFDEDPPEPPSDEEAARVCEELGVDLDALHRRILAMVDAHEAAERARAAAGDEAPESGRRPVDGALDSGERAAVSVRGAPSVQVLSAVAGRRRRAGPWLAAGAVVCAVAAAAAVAAIRMKAPEPPPPTAKETPSATATADAPAPATPAPIQVGEAPAPRLTTVPAAPGPPDAGPPPRPRRSSGTP